MIKSKYLLHLVKSLPSTLISCAYFIRRYLKHSFIHTSQTQAQLLGRISANTHVLEKGLSMPEVSLGFGYTVLEHLIQLLADYKSKELPFNETITSAIQVVYDYEELHESKNFTLKPHIVTLIQQIKREIPISSIQKSTQTYKPPTETILSASFDLFSSSRKSLRNFSSKALPIEEIKSAITLAQNAPSSCNRQSPRVHVIQDKDRINKILSIHNGNRGFGHLGTTLFVLSGDMSVYTGWSEHNLLYFDVGMFTMNLLYTLHFKSIAACTLNWAYSVKQDKQLRSIIEIPENEEVCALILAGSFPEETQIASSCRNALETIYTLHGKK